MAELRRMGGGPMTLPSEPDPDAVEVIPVCAAIDALRERS